jgi:ADP-heptose:LPS heptosyltransferase
LKTPRRILVIRNDKLGDFMLAWPAFALLRRQYPDATLIALVPRYTAPMAELCPSIDEVVIDELGGAGVPGLRGAIRAARADAAICFYSDLRTALALWLARVPVRAAPATKLAQLFHNRRLRQRRSQSAKPEYAYNLDLARWFIESGGGTPPADPQPPFLAFEPAELASIRAAFCTYHRIEPKRMLVFVHAGSGGSAVNLSLAQFAVIARLARERTGAHVVLTAGPDELDHAQRLSALLADTPHSVYHSTGGLAAFAKFIGICDAFISGSTGPLHVAGALDRPTIGFYPARRSATALRWQTLNRPELRLALMPDGYRGDTSSLDIDLDAARERIGDFLDRIRTVAPC